MVITPIYSPRTAANVVIEMVMVTATGMLSVETLFLMSQANGMIPMVMDLVTTTNPMTTTVIFVLRNMLLLSSKGHVVVLIPIEMELSIL